VGEPRWVDLQVVLAIHDEQLAEHGGESGVRDLGLLQSALARPRQRHAYSDAPLARLAASYAFGIARDHPFVDGNKRTALVVMELFLVMNGRTLNAGDEGCVMAFLRLADGSLGEEELAAWLSTHAVAED
jgi:death-on-curing protein